MANINISTVGNGGTYTNLDSWWYYILQGNGDLVTRDVVEIAEIQPGTYVSSGTILRMEPISGVNTDPNRFFVIRADSNNRFNGDTTYTPVRFNIFPTGTMAAFYSDVPYTRFEHLVVAQTGYFETSPITGRTVGFEIINGVVDSCGIIDLQRTSYGASGITQSVVGIKADSGCVARNNLITGLSTNLGVGNGNQTLTETIGILQQSTAAQLYNNTVYDLYSYNNLTANFVSKSKCHGYQYFDDGHPPAFDWGPVLWLDNFTNDRFAYSKVGAPNNNPMPLITFWYDRTAYGNHGSGNTNSVIFLFGHTSEGVDARGYSAAGGASRKMRSLAPLHDLSDGYTTFLLAKPKHNLLGGPAWFTTHTTASNDYYFYIGKDTNDLMIHKMSTSVSGITIHYTTGIPPNDIWFILTSVYDSTNGNIQTYYNGQLAGSGNYSNAAYTGLMAATISNYSLAGHWQYNDTLWLNSNNISGIFGAAVVYNRPLSKIERESVEWYLASRTPGFPEFTNYGEPDYINLMNNTILYSHNAIGNIPSSGDYFLGYQGVGFNNCSQDQTAKNTNWLKYNFDYAPTSLTGINPDTVFKSLSPFDAHILDTAPIKNSGVRLNSFIWDIDGQVRGDLWDMGADEAGSGIDSQGINEVAMSLHSDYGISDNSLTLFAQSQQESYGDIPFYTYGGVGTNDTLPLFVGNYYVEDGLPLVIGGENTDTSMILFVKVFGETLDKSMPLYTFSDTSEGGPPPGSGIRSLTLVVGNSITGEEITSMNLFIKGGGPLPDNASIPLYVETKGTGSGMPLYVHSWAAGIGENTATLLIPGSVWNPVFFTDPIPLTISGRIQVNVPLNLFLKSDTPTTTAAIPLFIHNSGLNKGLNLYARGYGFGDPYAEGLQGGQAAYTNMPLFINREFNSLAAWVPMTVWTSEGISSGVVPMYTHGFAGTSGSGMPLSMAPSYAQFNNITQLYTHGF